MQGIHAVPTDFLEKQLHSVLSDIGADVVSPPGPDIIKD